VSSDTIVDVIKNQHIRAPSPRDIAGIDNSPLHTTPMALFRQTSTDAKASGFLRSLASAYFEIKKEKIKAYLDSKKARHARKFNLIRVNIG
jgi:hypothetical protein